MLRTPNRHLSLLWVLRFSMSNSWGKAIFATQMISNVDIIFTCLLCALQCIICIRRCIEVIISWIDCLRSYIQENLLFACYFPVYRGIAQNYHYNIPSKCIRHGRQTKIPATITISMVPNCLCHDPRNPGMPSMWLLLSNPLHFASQHIECIWVCWRDMYIAFEKWQKWNCWTKPGQLAWRLRIACLWLWHFPPRTDEFDFWLFSLI